MAIRHRLGLFFGAIATVVLLVIAAIGILSRSQWGHEQVRRQVLSILQGNVHGVVRIGKVSGNLLTGATIDGIEIIDSLGHPFFTAEKISARYNIRAFLNQKLLFDDVTITRPLLLFDKPPGDKWNIARLWPSKPHPPGYVHKEGWGDWFELTNVRVIDGRVLVRAAWHPNDSLTSRQRDSVLAHQLGPKGKFVIEEVPGGWQRVSDFRHLNGVLPRLRIADPVNKWMLVDIATMTADARPLKGPPALVKDLKGRFEFTDDSAWFDNVKARLPGSRLTGGGRYYVDTDNLLLHLVAAPGAFKDFQFVYADFPDSGGGPVDFTMKWWNGVDTYTLKNMDFRVGRSHVEGNTTVTIYQVPDTVAFSGTELRFTNLDTRLIERVPPGLKFPRVGTMTGRASISGGTAAMNVDADVAYYDARAGQNHVVARGVVGVRGGIHARNLHVGLEPLQVALAKDYIKDLPVGGAITGNLVVNGDERTGLAARGGIVHVDRGLVSRATGRGTVRLAQAKGGSPWIDLDVRLHPLALAEAGKFAPSLGLRGVASGPLRLRGTMANLALNTELTTTGGGFIAAEGTVGLTGTPTYDLRTRMRGFNANAIVAKAPRTSLTGNVQARGVGTDPATMRLALAGRLTAIRVDTLTADSALFRLSAANGLLQIDTLRAAGRGLFAIAQGSLGLRPGRTGELRYDVRIDSLEQFGSFVRSPVDTGIVAPRPRAGAQRVARARADSARIARATEVERAATGRRTVQTPIAAAGTPAIRRDSLAGSVRAQGVLSGNVEQLNTNGTLELRNVVAKGSSVRRGTVQYTGVNLRAPSAQFTANASLDSLVVAGFELDSARGAVRYTKPGGFADITVHQAGGEVYKARGDFVFHPDHSEIHLADLSLQLDTTRWVSQRPSTINWGKGGIEVRTLELRSQYGGRLYANGIIPTEATSTSGLNLQLERFQLGDISALLQSDVAVTGVVDLNARVQGTLRDPRLNGTLSIARAHYGDTAIPDVRGTFGYASGILTTTAEAYGVPQDSAKGVAAVLAAVSRTDRPLVTVNGRIPINLGFGSGKPLLSDAPMDVTIKADSLPIDLLPQFVAVVDDVHGSARGDIHLRGTIKQPKIEGAVTLANAQVTIVPTGVTLTDLNARLRMRNDTVVVDTLAARAGKGFIAMGGSVDVRDFAKPAFDLRLAAVNAQVIDNERGHLNVDATIAMQGPLNAVVVDGIANVRNGVIYLPESQNRDVISTSDPTIFAVADTSVRRDRELVAGESPFLQNLVLDIGLTVQRDTWVRSKEANVEIYGDVNIRMDRYQDALALEGAINTDRGEYTMLSKRFLIRQGSATFLNLPEHGLNPILQITAENEVRVAGQEPLIVRLTIGGTLENPKLALSSNAQPPIPQSDLLSYVAFGRSTGTLLQLGGGSSLGGTSTSGGIAGSAIANAATSTLAGVALGVLADEAEGEATRSMGIDQFNISTDPELVTQLSSGAGRIAQLISVEGGKYVNPRTFVAVSVQNLVPGGRIETRARGGLVFQGFVEPRLPLRTPSLENQTSTAVGASRPVFGAVVRREWRF